ncbi:hypothetical protein [Allobranchiibius sp. GilTou38]|uniref:hypothetical protein n=1 Tax=Allobranchiibius sp. GilTou38 TaxID=2815210 RepID=UPI001AA1387E|nr:hypothetical protein [Allobranchiibius sp. GilTou38]MBO1767482.1 hypothetical protein [Allobranchiibius sp. GilTou38]
MVLGAAGVIAAGVSAGCSSEPRKPETAIDVFDNAWAAVRKAHPDSAYPGPNSGPQVLPWETSYILQALQTMVRVTGERRYADDFVRISRRVLSLRDQELGHVAFDGQSGPVWSVADRYTVLQATLNDNGGAPCLLVSSAAPGVAQPQRLRVEPNADGHFDLYVFDARNGQLLDRVKGLSTHRGDPAYAPMRLRALSPTSAWLTCRDMRGSSTDSVQLAAAEHTMAPARVSFAVHTGMIAAPLMEFATTVSQNAKLRSYTSDAEAYRSAASAAWAHHRAQIKNVDGYTCMVMPRGTPARVDGTPLPHNQSLAYARLGSGVGRSYGDATISSVSAELFKTVISDMRPVPGEEGVIWPYYWSKSSCYSGFSSDSNVSEFTPSMPATKAAEDTQHGAIDVMALVAGRANNAGVSDSTIKILANTYGRLVSSGCFAASLSPGAHGCNGSAAGLWAGSLVPGSSALDKATRAQLHQARKGDPSGVNLLGAALVAAASPRSVV